MNSHRLLFLRPYLFSKCAASPSSAPLNSALAQQPQHARFFTTAQRQHLSSSAPARTKKVAWRQTTPAETADPTGSHADSEFQKRMEKLREYGVYDDLYPRLRAPAGKVMTLDGFRVRYANLKKEERDASFVITLRGRVSRVRHGGAKLVFFSLAEPYQSIQIICSLSSMEAAGVEAEEFKRFAQVVRKGDWFSISGHPEKTKSGTVSLRATQMPQLLSPSLHQHPDILTDKERRARKRHVDLIANPEAAEMLRLRAAMESSLQTYFQEHGYTKVTTPILSARASGASARPFETVATELSDQTLQLRVAPELFLKRLVVGGMRGVYEIGPVFRNEGIDLTHNPEFTICEFYKPLLNLEELMAATQTIFRRLQKAFETRKQDEFPHMPDLDVDFRDPIARLDFIETLEKTLGRKMPDLNEPASVEELLVVFRDHAIPLPSVAVTPTPDTSTSTTTPDPTAPDTTPATDPQVTALPPPTLLPRLLDALAKHIIEPQCGDPTFIVHHPAVMSPLAKSFVDPRSGQMVSARAELFVRGREYVNCYEEENSPFEQRTKFEGQQRQREQMSWEGGGPTAFMGSSGGECEIDRIHGRDPSDPSVTDSNSNSNSNSGNNDNNNIINTPHASYLEALEWGLPPTGGWGVGLERLVMLFSGRHRIADALPFGTLRNVVGLDAGGRNRR